MDDLVLTIISQSFPQRKFFKKYIPMNSPQHTECPHKHQQNKKIQPRILCVQLQEFSFNCCNKSSANKKDMKQMLITNKNQFKWKESDIGHIQMQ